MGYPTPIEWTDATWNPIGGCSIASPGCNECYAQLLAGTRLRDHPLYAGTTSPAPKNGRPLFNGTMTALPADHPTWSWPQRWRGAAAPKLGPGMPSLIFVGDMSDLFHEARSIYDIDNVLVALLASKHIGQLLTKRSARMLKYFAELPRRQLDWQCHSALDACTLPLANVWLGTSVERQQEADARRAPMAALAAMGFTTFISYEPALGPVDWTGWEFLSQLISGGESGDRARPSHPDWHRAARTFCDLHGIAYFFKQWGSRIPCTIVRIGDEGEIWRRDANGKVFWFFDELGKPRADVDEVRMLHVGKREAGHLLDGVEHRAFPPIAAAAITGVAA